MASRNGLHPDPALGLQSQGKTNPPELFKEVQATEMMGRFRSALLLDGMDDPREAVLDDLSSFYGFSKEECVRRCIDWEQWSVEEWHQRPRESADAIADFYHTTQSWSFDLLWYAYLQSSGLAAPLSVVVAEDLPKLAPGSRHLDFGSGVGVTSQLFKGLGYKSDLSDISTTLLDFARFRYQRRKIDANFIDLNVEGLPDSAYDVVTAIDTLAHVPDIARTAEDLHKAIKPGGLLYATFDTRPAAPENAWHLYSDDLPLRWSIQRAGFEPEACLGRILFKYRRVDSSGLRHRVSGLRDNVLLKSPLRRLARKLSAHMHT